MNLIFQILIVGILAYGVLGTIAAVYSMFSAEAEIGDVMLQLFGFAVMVILLIKNPTKTDFCPEILGQIKMAGKKSSDRYIEGITDNSLLQSLMESGVELVVDDAIENSGGEFCRRYVRRNNFFIFSTFITQPSSDKKIKHFGIGGFFFKIDRQSEFFNLVQ
jgi:hypothetical protein